MSFGSNKHLSALEQDSCRVESVRRAAESDKRQIEFALCSTRRTDLFKWPFARRQCNTHRNTRGNPPQHILQRTPQHRLQLEHMLQHTIGRLSSEYIDSLRALSADCRQSTFIQFFYQNPRKNHRHDKLWKQS